MLPRNNKQLSGESAYSDIAATPLLLSLIAGLIGGLALSAWLGIPADHAVADLITDLIMFGGTGTLLAIQVFRTRSPRWAETFASFPRTGWPLRTALVGLLLLFSIGSVIGLVLPLSYMWPEFVETHVLAEPSYAGLDPASSLVVRILQGSVTLLVAPMVEEGVFRGVLLTRLERRLGTRRAILLSSLMFGSLHADVIGGVMFGAVMGSLYSDGRALSVPIVCHVLYNSAGLALDWSLTSMDLIVDTIYDIQTWCQWGLLGLMAVIPLICYLRNHLPKNSPPSAEPHLG